MQVVAKLSSDPSLHKQTDLPSPLGNHVVDELDFMSANELEDVAGRLGLDERAEYVVSAEQRGAMHLDSTTMTILRRWQWSTAVIATAWLEANAVSRSTLQLACLKERSGV